MRLTNLSTSSLYKFTFMEIINRYNFTLGKEEIKLPVDISDVLYIAVEIGELAGANESNQEFVVVNSLREWLRRHTDNSYAFDMQSIDVEMNEGGFENESMDIVTGDFIGETQYLLESFVGEYYNLYKHQVQVTHQNRLTHVESRTEASWAFYLESMQEVADMQPTLQYMEEQLVELFPVEQIVLF